MTLPNGLVAVIDSRPQRRTIYCEIGVRVGSRNEPLALAGMSHLLEHLLFKEGEAPGSRKNPAFSRIRAAGGEVNAMTSFESTSYYCDVHASAFEEGWRGLANLVTATGFDAHDVDVERKIVLEEAALDKKNPLTVAAYSVLDRLFPDDPLCQPVIGFRKTLRRIRFEDVDAYYRRFYAPVNAWALIVGDVAPEPAAALLAETLGAWRRSDARSHAWTLPNSASHPLHDDAPRPSGGSVSTTDALPPLVAHTHGAPPTSSRTAPASHESRFPPAPLPADTKRFVFHTFTHEVYYGAGILTGGQKSADRAALALLTRVLTGSRSARLERRVVETEGLTSEMLAGGLDLSNLGVFAAGGAVPVAKSARFREVLREELSRLAAEPVSEEELKLAKALLAADLVRAFESNDGIAAFRSERLLYGQSVSRDAWLDELQRLTPSDLQGVARARFAPENLREVEIRPARGFGKVLAAIRYLVFRRL